jgi:peptidoglycan/xylan/chitin deacetylase (PgdA/CDA1 family)
MKVIQKLPETKLLMYHSLAQPGYKPSAGFARFVLETHLFEEQLAWLKTEGYTSATVSAFIQRETALEKSVPEKTAPEKTVILTFDDALADFELAVPLLKKYGFTATLFVPTAFVGKTSSWLRGVDGEHPMLSWQALRDLAKEGIDIAAHGHGHLQLDNVLLDTAKKDIERGKGLLEDQLGQRVTSFAYPYGYYTSKIKHLVAQAGFAGACAVDKRLAAPDAFALPRLTVAGGTTAKRLARLMARPDSKQRDLSTSVKAVLWRTARRCYSSFNVAVSQDAKPIESRQS